MNRVILFLLVLLLLPSGLALSSSSEGSGSGEGFFDSQIAPLFCDSSGALCSDKPGVSDSSSFGVNDDLIVKYTASTTTNELLSKKELTQKRIDSARERSTSMFTLISYFWVLVMILLEAFFIFLEVYIVFWGVFIAIPKLLALILKKMIKSEVFEKWTKG